MVTFANTLSLHSIFLQFAAEIMHSESEKKETENRFTRLISKHEGIINKICYSYAICSDDFNDLRQDVLVNLWRGMDSFRGNSSVVTWVYRVALNTCVSAARKRVARKEQPLAGILEQSENDDSENDRVVILHEMIASLPLEERALILLWLDEIPYDEIAEVMGYPRNTVAVKLHRIKEKLKSNYKNQH